LPDSVKSVYAGDELDVRKLLEAAEANRLFRLDGGGLL